LKEVPGAKSTPQHSKTKSMDHIYAAFEIFTRRFSAFDKNTILNIKDCDPNIVEQRTTDVLFNA